MPWSWEVGPEPVAMPGVQSMAGESASEDAPGRDKDGTLSVSEAVNLVKGKVKSLPTLVVTGEVTGFRGPNARSGHCYFQVKDDAAAMDVTMWKYVYQKLDFELRDGLQVQMTGAFDVYDRRGSLSFNIKSMTVAGEGLLRQQVAELARRLEREGLMDSARKRPIPRFCERVCVVTSLSGAVIDDVKRTLARRNPLVEIQAAGCMVQGPGAPEQIIRALQVAVAAKPDAILLVRGGGSFEDLMTFNDEALARAVAACPVPVITGIGHEPDTCICDMVADRRCSTPTAAAESVAPAFDEVEKVVIERRERMSRAMRGTLEAQEKWLDSCGQSAQRSLGYTVSKKAQYIDALAAHQCLQDPLFLVHDREGSLELTAERLHGALPRLLTQRRSRLDDDVLLLRNAGTRLLRPYEHRLAQAAGTLEALSPLKVLSRGYALVRDEDGHVVNTADALAIGDEVDMLLGAGSARAKITEIGQSAEKGR